jgi:Tfp pilus assembly protein PilF
VAHYALGLAYRKLRDTARSALELVLYQIVLACVPPAEDPLMAVVQGQSANAVDLLRRAADLDSEGRLGDAAALQEKALALDPSLVQAHINLISLYDRLGQPAVAEGHYHAALALNPNRADCHYNYGVFLFGHHRYGEAEAAFRRAIQINPSYAEAQSNLGFVLEELGRPYEAIQAYRQAIGNQPNYRLAHFHLGRLLASGGDYTAAIRELRQTLEPEDDNTPGYLYALGAAYTRSADYVNGRLYLEKARDEARARGQQQMLASIDRDLETLARLKR